MGTIKTVVCAVCVIGVVSAMIDIVSPEGNLKKHLEMVVGIILLLTIIYPFTGKGFKISLSQEINTNNDSTMYNEIMEYESKAVLEKTNEEMSAYLKNKLNSAGIPFKDVVIKSSKDEYNQIVIQSVTIYADKEDERIEKIIASELKDTKISIIAGDTIEKQDK